MLAGYFEACLLCGTCYLLGASSLNPTVATLLLVAIVLLVTSVNRRNKERAAKAILIQSTGTGKNVQKAMTREMLEMLPSWVTFPDTERADWLNTFVHKLWPFLSAATEDTMKGLLNPKLASLVKGTPIRRLFFTKFSLGDTPLNIAGVRCHSRGSHSEIVLDLDVRLAGQPDVQLEAGVSSFACVPVMLAELQLVGTLRLVFTPLCTDWPCFAGMSIGFIKKPIVDCRLSVATNALDIMSLPGVSDALLSIITNSLASYFTWPNFVPISILGGEYGADPDTQLMAATAGVLEVELLEVTGLRRPPKGTAAATGTLHTAQGAMSLLAMFSPICPYATLSLSASEPLRFATVREQHGRCELGVLTELIVDQGPQAGEELCIRVFDDQLSDTLLGELPSQRRAELARLRAPAPPAAHPPRFHPPPPPGCHAGSCVLDLAQLAAAPDAALDKSLPLLHGASGMHVHVRAQWRPFPPASAGGLLPADSAQEVSSPPLVAHGRNASSDWAPDFRVSRRSLRAGRLPGPAVGVLSVRLHCASELLAADFGGSSDPYAVLQVGDAAPQRTRTVHKTCAPCFEEKFRFVVRDVDSEALSISLWDHDKVGKHDSLGQLRLKLSDLARRPRTHGTFTIMPPDKPTRGKQQRVTHYGTLTMTAHWRQLVPAAELLGPGGAVFAAPDAAALATWQVIAAVQGAVTG